MRREYKYQTIGQYAEHKEQEAKDWLAWGVIVGILFIGLALSIYVYTKPLPAQTISLNTRPTATLIDCATEGSNVACWGNSGPTYPKPRSGYSLDQARAAAKEAVRLWSIALGTRVKMPQVKLGVCGPAGYACASKEEYTINVADLTTRNVYGQEPDAVTIMLHEVAHLLGVPHIEGDELMSAIYLKKLAGPTKDAVAIARAHRKD